MKMHPTGPGLKKALALSATMSRALVAVAFLLSAIAPCHAFAEAQNPGIIVADFNHDGIPDALVLSTSTASSFVALGAVPLGTFSSSVSVTFADTCTVPFSGSTAIGDFNGDGFPDIAFSCANSNGFFGAGVLLGNGDGTFGAPQLLDAQFGQILLVADFNQDGHLDLATIVASPSSQGSAIVWVPGNGDGTFGFPVTVPIAGVPSYTTASVADINQDGYPDIVAGNFGGTGNSTLDVFGNNKDGTFGLSSQGLFSPSTSIQVGTAPAVFTGILTGNFYGSGLPDLVAVSTGQAGGLALVKNSSSGATFAFGSAINVPYPNLQSAQAAVFTGSGFSDLLAFDGTTFTVLDNDGTGAFGTNFASLRLQANPQSFLAADANGDGYADLYLLSSSDSGSQLTVSLVSGSASAVSQPVSLNPGTKTVTATWAGNQNFLGSTATGTVLVNPAQGQLPTSTTLTADANPANLGSPVVLTADVAAVNSTRLVPTGTVVFNDGSTTLGQTNLDATGAATFTANGLALGPHSITAAYEGDRQFGKSQSAALALHVVLPAPTVVFSGPTTLPSGEGPNLNFQLANPYPADLTATFTLSFTSLVPQRTDDSMVKFGSLQMCPGCPIEPTNNGRMLTFTIPAHSTLTELVPLQTGSIAGTITVSLTLTVGTANVTPSNLAPVVITIPFGPPIVMRVSLTGNGDSLTVIVHGLSNTLDMTNAAFTFTGGNGSLINPSLTLEVPDIFAQWFNSTNSIQYGSSFTYSQQFKLNQPATNFKSVTVTLSNTAGQSTPVASQ